MSTPPTRSGLADGSKENKISLVRGVAGVSTYGFYCEGIPHCSLVLSNNSTSIYQGHGRTGVKMKMARPEARSLPLGYDYMDVGGRECMEHILEDKSGHWKERLKLPS